MKRPEKDHGVNTRPTKMSCAQGRTYSSQETTVSGDKILFLSERYFILLGILSYFHLLKKLKSEETLLRFDNKLIVKGQL